MKNLFSCSMLIFLSILILVNTQTSCDYSLQMISTDMGNFNTKAFNPLNPENLYNRLNELRASVLTAYQLCFGKIIIDPDSLYPQDVTQCFHGLYNVSLLTNTYTGQFSKIKAQIDTISKIVFSTQNDCRPVLYYKGWDNLTSDCKGNIPALDDLFNSYGQQISMGKSGLQYINNMILLVQRLRKLCGFNILTKANTWANDNCQATSNNWLYPLTDQMDTYYIQGKYLNFTATFYNLYQSLYRVKNVCNVSLDYQNEQQSAQNEANQVFNHYKQIEKYLTADE